MFSYNVLRQRCGNILETFLENVSQMSPNVMETLLQQYIVSLEKYIVAYGVSTVRMGVPFFIYNSCPGDTFAVSGYTAIRY